MTVSGTGFPSTSSLPVEGFITFTRDMALRAGGSTGGPLRSLALPCCPFPQQVIRLLLRTALVLALMKPQQGEQKMGLDMYAFKTDTPIPDVDFKAAEGKQQIAYWHKHPNLHGWMEALYYSKGGQQESFNCVPVRLDAADLDALERAVNDNSLPDTTGFFFGETLPDEIETDRAFIAAARSALSEGYCVYYDSWW